MEELMPVYRIGAWRGLRFVLAVPVIWLGLAVMRVGYWIAGIDPREQWPVDAPPDPPVHPTQVMGDRTGQAS